MRPSKIPSSRGKLPETPSFGAEQLLDMPLGSVRVSLGSLVPIHCSPGLFENALPPKIECKLLCDLSKWPICAKSIRAEIPIFTGGKHLTCMSLQDLTPETRCQRVWYSRGKNVVTKTDINDMSQGLQQNECIGYSMRDSTHLSSSDLWCYCPKVLEHL